MTDAGSLVGRAFLILNRADMSDPERYECVRAWVVQTGDKRGHAGLRRILVTMHSSWYRFLHQDDYWQEVVCEYPECTW